MNTDTIPFESLMMVDSVLKKIMQRVHSIIYSKHIVRTTPVHTVADTTSFISTVVALKDISHDFESNGWRQSEEPVPSIEDICARGSLDIEEITVISSEKNMEVNQTKLRSTIDLRISYSKTLKEPVRFFVINRNP